MSIISTRPIHGDREKIWNTRVSLLAPVTFLALSILYCYVAYDLEKVSSTTRFFIIFLLSVPLGQIIVFRLMSGNNYLSPLHTTLMLLSLFSYQFFWLCYSMKWWTKNYEYLSYASAVISFIIVILSFYAAYAVAKGEKPESENPFLPVCFFLCVLLNITYLLTFSFAFHHMSDSRSLELTVGSESKAYQYNDQRIKQISNSKSKENYGALLFENNNNNIDIKVKNSYKVVDRLKEYLDKQIEGGYRQFEIKIITYIHKDDTGRRQHRISDSMLHVSYNFLSTELAPKIEAEELYIEWHFNEIPYYSKSYEELIKTTEKNVDGEIKKNKTYTRFVHVYISTLGNTLYRLNLLDYLYFTIYTITTTGYGDIIPISDYSRFLVSIANLYEVFYMVIFFNIIISFTKQLSSKPAS